MSSDNSSDGPGAASGSSSDADSENADSASDTSGENAGGAGDAASGNPGSASAAPGEDAGDGSESPGENEVYCRDCGAVIRADAEICPECGVRQRSPDTGFDNRAGIAAVASLLIPGAGQIYLGHLGRGLGFLAASFVAGLFSVFLVGIPFLLAIWVYAIYDAYRLAEDAEPQG